MTGETTIMARWLGDPVHEGLKRAPERLTLFGITFVVNNWTPVDRETAAQLRDHGQFQVDPDPPAEPEV